MTFGEPTQLSGPHWGALGGAWGALCGGVMPVLSVSVRALQGGICLLPSEHSGARMVNKVYRPPPPRKAAVSLCLFRADSRCHRGWRVGGSPSAGRRAGPWHHCFGLRDGAGAGGGARNGGSRGPRHTDGGTWGGMENTRKSRQVFQRGDTLSP